MTTESAIELVSDRHCLACDTVKSDTEFYSRYKHQCYSCLKKQQAERKRIERARNPEKYREKDRLYKKRRMLMGNPKENSAEIILITAAIKAFPDGRKNQPKKAISKSERALQQKKARLKLYYGLSLDEADSMLKSQMGLCANRACGKEISLYGKDGKIASAAVDHCHSSGKVRGIVCSRCNLALGYLDNKNLVLGLTEYLNKFDLNLGI